mmetsp:Transcript_19148/g.29065  ORF Transcript_19148/g.29065 Transcript_19148/m.29065 type:complete len:535 (-) Transcript_19148:58-1662(-)
MDVDMDVDDATKMTTATATDGFKELEEQLKILYGGSHGLNLRPLDISKKNAKMLLDKLEKIKRSSASVEERKKLLAKILPQWHKVYKEVEEEDGESEKEEEEGGGIGTGDDVTGDDVMSNNSAGAGADEENENDNTKIIRTLHNKNHHHKESKCERGLSEISPTFVSQTTLDRLPILLESCQRWTGPMIVTVYVTEEEYEMEWDNDHDHGHHGIVSDVMKKCPHAHENLELIPYIAKSDEERKYEYPINTLRNIALDHVKTSHMIMLDIDMVPSEGLYNEVLTAIEMSIDARLDDDGDRGLDPKDAIVIPAFERKLKIQSHSHQSPCETLEGCQQLIKEDPNFIPGTMPQLLRCIEGKDCIVFQSDVNWDGHADTKTTKVWLKQEGKDKEAKTLPTIPCFKSLRYEPYVATPWCPLEANAERRLAVRAPRSPYYDERFYGYGKNKIQQIAHLRARGFKFHILQTTGFVIHFPHPESTTKEVWNNRKGGELHQQMDQLYIRYLKELQRQYEDYDIETPTCKIQREMKKRLHKPTN